MVIRVKPKGAVIAVKPKGVKIVNERCPRCGGKLDSHGCCPECGTCSIK